MFSASPVAATCPAMPAPSGTRISSGCSPSPCATFDHSSPRSSSTRKSVARVGVEDLADLEREGLEHLLEHALEGLGVAHLDDAQELLALARHLLEQRGELRRPAARATLAAPARPCGCAGPASSIMCCVLAMTALVNDESRPSSRWMMRSAMSRMRLSWVTSRTVHALLAWPGRASASTTSRPDCLSSDAVGSSASTMRGRADERARDRDALLLAARELVWGSARARSPRPTAVEHLVGALARLAARTGRACSCSAISTFWRRGQRVEQVVRLEDVADLPAHARRARARRAAQLLAEHAQAAVLRRAQRADQVSSVVLPEPDGPVRITISPRADLGRDVEQDLLAQRARRRSSG